MSHPHNVPLLRRITPLLAQLSVPAWVYLGIALALRHALAWVLYLPVVALALLLAGLLRHFLAKARPGSEAAPW